MKLNFKLMLFIAVFLNFFGIRFSSAYYSELPKLITKQDISKIRFITSDGKATYYQRGTGSLALSINYQVKEILSGPEGTNYFLLSSPARRKIIIQMDPFYFSSNAINNPKMIFYTNFGEGNPFPIGKGIAPNLHLNDSWVSYYDPQDKNIHFHSFEKKINFNIKLIAATNPYYIPYVKMISDKEILYTDINAKGEQAVFLVDRNKKSNSVVYNPQRPGVKLEICLNNNTLYIGEFPYIGISGSSFIKQIGLSENTDYSKLNTLYESKLPDIGNILCQTKSQSIFFIKNISTEKLPLGSESDLYKIDPSTKKLIKSSDIRFVTQILEMDGIVLIPYRGEFFVVEGDFNLNKDNLNEKDKLKGPTENAQPTP